MYNRDTLWLHDTARQTSLGKSAAGADRRPLTSIGMSAWPYRVTTKYSFYLVRTYKMLNKKIIALIEMRNTVIWWRIILSILVWCRLPRELTTVTSPVKWSPRAEGPTLCSKTQELHLAHKKPDYEYGCIPYLVIKKIVSKSPVYTVDWHPAFAVTSKCLGIPLRSARVAPLLKWTVRILRSAW